MLSGLPCSRAGRAKAAFCAWLLLMIGGCAQTPDRPASEAEQAIYQEIVALSETDPEQGARELESFAKTYPESPLADDAALRIAEIALERGAQQLAIDWLWVVIKDYSGETSADRARLRLATLYAERSDEVEARRLLSKLRFARLEPDERRDAYALMSELSRDPVDRLGWRVREREALIEVLAEQESERADPAARQPERAELERLIAESIDAMTDSELTRTLRHLRGDYPSARISLVLAHRYLQVADFDEAEKYRDRARKVGIEEADAALEFEVSLAISLGERIDLQKDALPTFAAVAERPQPVTEGASGTLGVILPLTGRYAEYGEASLRGILAAAGLFDPPPAPISAAEREQAELENLDASLEDRFSEPDAERDVDPTEANGAETQDQETELVALEDTLPEFEELAERQGLRLLVRDTGGTPEGAAEAVRELAEDESLMAIVGPLLGASAEAAAVVAQELEVPLVALTSREEVPLDRPYVFRVRTTPEDEIQRLVSYAADEKGAKRYAILYPQDDYGFAMRDRFWAAVDAAGGEIVASAGYDPGVTHFAEPIRRMIGFSLLSDEEKQTLERREEILRRARRLEPADAAIARRITYAITGPEGDPLPPVVDFDALFIPDSHDRIVLIAPQLTFNEVNGVQLLGPGEWNHPELVSIGRKHVRGAVISALFHKSSRFPFVADFVRDYESIYQSEPDVFSAHSYDATRILMVQLAAGEITRKGVRDGILLTQGFPGASGVISVKPDGNARKRPFLLQVRGGRIISLD